MQKETYKLSKRERKMVRKKGVQVDANTLRLIKPITRNQKRIFESYYTGKNIFIYGSAGTGKSFTAMYLGIKDILNDEYSKMMIVRSAVPSRDIGFLPGTMQEKMAEYEAPYNEICNKLFDRDDSYKILKNERLVEFVPTSYLRGRTFDDCLILVDECQNLNWQELYTIMTRVGENCRLMLCGDIRQSDLDTRKGYGDILKLIEVCKRMDQFDFIEMGHDDIVRSNFPKQFIIHCEELNY